MMTGTHPLLDDLQPIIDFLNDERDWIKECLFITSREKNIRIFKINQAEKQIETVLERHAA